MFIAMNRFQVAAGREEAFEAIWKNRDSHLKEVEGFLDFKLLKGASTDDHTLYASHSLWASRAAFEAWTKSEHFRRAHRDVGDTSGLYLGPPVLELYDAVDGA